MGFHLFGTMKSLFVNKKREGEREKEKQSERQRKNKRKAKSRKTEGDVALGYFQAL